jgi:hypothetical protein
MKRTTLFVSAALFGHVLLFSCKKSYDCSCHKVDGTHEHINIETTKSEAYEECQAKAVGAYINCEID